MFFKVLDKIEAVFDEDTNLFYKHCDRHLKEKTEVFIKNSGPDRAKALITAAFKNVNGEMYIITDKFNKENIYSDQDLQASIEVFLKKESNSIKAISNEKIPNFESEHPLGKIFSEYKNKTEFINGSGKNYPNIMLCDAFLRFEISSNTNDFEAVAVARHPKNSVIQKYKRQFDVIFEKLSNSKDNLAPLTT